MKTYFSAAGVGAPPPTAFSRHFLVAVVVILLLSWLKWVGLVLVLVSVLVWPVFVAKLVDMVGAHTT
jgi:hypothetical protein